MIVLNSKITKIIRIVNDTNINTRAVGFRDSAKSVESVESVLLEKLLDLIRGI